MTRRFPPPWSVEELDACFVVTDSAGQALAYVYHEDDEPGQRPAAKLLSKDEARRIALNIAKLPQFARAESPKRPTPEQRGGVENWLAEKHAEDAAGQRWALLGWALVGVLAGIIVIGAIALWLAKWNGVADRGEYRKAAGAVARKAGQVLMSAGLRQTSSQKPAADPPLRKGTSFHEDGRRISGDGRRML